MSAGYGFAEGFAKGMEKNFREWAADEKDAAAVAAARYEENRKSFFEKEKEDQLKIQQADQIIEQLYSNEAPKDKEARKTDAVQLLRSGNSFKDVLALMQERQYEKIKEEEEKKPQQEVKVDTTTPNTTTTEEKVVGNVVDQTNEMLSSEDVTKAVENTGASGFETKATDESKDEGFKTEGKDESDDKGFFGRIGERMENRSQKRIDKRVDKLTGTDRETREKYREFKPSSYLEPSGTTFTLKPDKTDIPSSLKALAVENLVNSPEFQATPPGSKERKALIDAAIEADKKEDSPPGTLNALLTDNIINSPEYKNAPVGSETRKDLIIEANDELRSKDDVIGLASLVEELRNLDPKDAGYDSKKEDLEKRIEYASQVEIYQDRLKASFGEDPTRIIDKTNPTTIQYVRKTPKIDGTEVYVNPTNSQQIDMTNYVVITEQMDTEANNIKKRLNTEFDKYNEKLVDTVDAITMTGQVIQLIDDNPLMLTTTGGTIPSVLKGAGLEVIGLVDTVNKLSKSMKDGETIDLATFETEAGLGELSLADIDKMLTDTLGQGIVDQATARALYNAKILLMAFRLGGLEGQSGNALSNKDFERLQLILNPSRDTGTAKTALRDYMATMVREQDTRAGLLNNNPEMIDFKTKYEVGVFMTLGDNPIITIDEMAKSDKYINNQGFQNGWQYIENYEPGEDLPRSGEENKAPPITVLNQNSLDADYEKLESGSKYSYIDDDGNVIVMTKP
jgi:hypothetical protein